jgi:PKHD-type hydroxylase
MLSKKIFPQEEKDMVNWYWFERGFSTEEIDQVHAHARNISSDEALILGSNSPDLSYRKSRIGWLTQIPDHNWLFDKLMNMVVQANNVLWGFDLHSTFDDIQYTEYLGGGGHYDYHLDLGPGTACYRKISVVVQLSEPTEYEGGELQILKGRDPEIMPNNKGAVIIFPSYLLHRVTPVTSGLRRSLVMWMGGTHYR